MTIPTTIPTRASTSLSTDPTNEPSERATNATASNETASNASATPHVDFGVAADDYATHRRGFPRELLRRLQAHGVGLPEQDVVDLGTGTGSLARLFAEAGGRTIGLDVSPAMIASARASGGDVRFEVAPAEATGLPDACADVVCAGQAWHWFDRPRAASEARRLLRANGTLVIAHLDWIRRPGNVVDRSLEAIAEHGGDLALLDRFPTHGTYGRWIPELEAAGFGAFETFSFDVDLRYALAAWIGRLRASAYVRPSLGPEVVDALDRTLEARLAARFGPTLAVPHRVFALVARRDAVAPTLGDEPPLPRWTPVGRPGRPRSHRRPLAREASPNRALGLGCSLYVLAPGEAPFARHAHAANDEAIYVLDGEGELELGDTRHPLRAGDYVPLPADPTLPHRLRGGRVPLRCLVVSTMCEPDVVFYPDSGKVGVFVGSAPGGDPDARRLGAFFVEREARGYWDGEPE
jgi:SAM-dependent methyltransferase/quercetin dioxygenase-like cupin family protein